MPIFRVGVCEDHGGYLTVIANNEKEAEEKAVELVDEYGLDGIPEKFNFDKTARETYSCDVQAE
jgi:hypothetical protein